MVVFHDDPACANLVSALLSKLGFECLRLATIAQLRAALTAPCRAVVVDLKSCSLDSSEIYILLEAARVPLIIAIESNEKAESDSLRTPHENLRKSIRILRLEDLSSDRLADCFLSPGPKAVGDHKQDAGDTVMQMPFATSSKLRIIQSMLHEAVADVAPDMTMVFSRTLPSNVHEARDRVTKDPRIAKLPTMILQGQSLAALAICHEVEESPAGFGANGTLPTNVSDLRRCLEQELLTSDIELVTADLRLCPVSKRNVLIGRPSQERTADIAINCRWFSRADKGLCLSSEGAEWFVEDLGSANGSFIGEKQLRRNSRHTLPLGQTTIEIGRSFDRRSPVILHLNRAAPDVVVVSVSVGAAFDKASWPTWPTLQEDLQKRWLVFRDEFVLGSDYANKALGIEHPDRAAAITFRNGYWITPLEGRELHIDNIGFRSAVPLPAGSDLNVDSITLRIERARESAVEPALISGQVQATGGKQQ